uniref:Uncharacterized protein LOC114325817 n=1 Tax=Diabrotica virgifera virgifera TaxID=50390 RepID=A0A6P7F7S7_DIAVI
MIRDRLVIGIRDMQLQQRLLGENDLNLDKVINAGRTAEISKKQAKTLQGKNDSHITQNESINVIEKRTNEKKSNHALNSTNVSPGKFKCTRCTRIHSPRECPAFNLKCEKCGKLNHFAVACRVRMVRQLEGSVEVGPNNSSQGDNNSEFLMYTLYVVDVKSNSWFETVNVINKPVNFKLDTVAEVNILPYYNVYRELGVNQHLEPTIVKLEALGGGGGIIKPAAFVYLECNVKNLSTIEKFLVVFLTYNRGTSAS